MAFILIPPLPYPPPGRVIPTPRALPLEHEGSWHTTNHTIAFIEMSYSLNTHRNTFLTIIYQVSFIHWVLNVYFFQHCLRVYCKYCQSLHPDYLKIFLTIYFQIPGKQRDYHSICNKPWIFMKLNKYIECIPKSLIFVIL